MVNVILVENLKSPFGKSGMASYIVKYTVTIYLFIYLFITS